MTNRAIADRLRSYANELADRGDNLYRIRAIRRAAFAVRSLPEPLESVVAQGGPAGVVAVAGIGSHLAEAVATFALTGEWKPRKGKATSALS